jgi:dTMP kinase
MSARFIVFEGIDGCGKTTQARLLVDALLRRRLRAEKIREPGATAVGERIRGLLLHASGAISVPCELFLYMAARAQLVQERIRPLLASGVWVVCDRYVYSSAAYQGEAGGLGVDRVLEIGKLAIDGAVPHHVFLLDLDPREAARRTAQKRADRIEKRGLGYQNRVRRGFLRLKRRLGRRMSVLDASRPPEDLHREIVKFLRLP